MVENTKHLGEGMAQALSAQAEAGMVPGMKRGALEGHVGPHVRLVRNQLAARVLATFAPFGLPSGAFSMLALIGANPGCSQADLAREAGLDKSLIVALLDELEARGILLRTRCEQDRRRNVLMLTPAGTALLHEMSAASASIEQPIEEALSKDEIEQLCDLLNRAYQALIETGKEKSL
jgi:DNA-binding MarR family transcriptional regulator